ncbi:NADPH-flavin oxidoreductase [termite gut metagenome]|uniref:NADPH-flavin oxidoreductase n=1 Tax=termite gut metagenome TaxID=433724 RepID=A0A5J4SMG9_9ZZZZ
MRNFLLTLFVVTLFASCAQEKVEVKSKASVVYENILSRRSIRSYKPEQVSKAQLDTIIQCAINAPSARNDQSWQVRIIQNSDLLNRIREVNSGFSHGAPTLIVVAKDKNNDFSNTDCGFLAQNILLIAEAMDLGTVVLANMGGIPNNPDAKDIIEALALPDTHEVLFTIAIGYKTESPDAKERDASKVQYID